MILLAVNVYYVIPNQIIKSNFQDYYEEICSFLDIDITNAPINVCFLSSVSKISK